MMDVRVARSTLKNALEDAIAWNENRVETWGAHADLIGQTRNIRCNIGAAKKRIRQYRACLTSMPVEVN